MCGIFASTCLTEYARLFSANQQRGTFASSLVFHSREEFYIKKVHGRLSLEDSLDILDADINYNLYLGHVQAPTSSCRDWSTETSHPFEVGDWVVAHNGVLENDKQLKCDHSLTYSNPVDSFVIPAMLNSMDVGDPIRCISETSSLLKGTFACWIYNKHYNKFYLIRSGSTLYHDPERAAISSVSISSVAETIDEGIIYEMSVDEGIYPVGKFTTNSPFLIL